MAAKRGKSQAKRNGGGNNPAWLWVGVGLAIGVVAVVAVPKLLPKGDGDGFFRPKPNADAQPVAANSAEEEDAVVPEDAPSPNAKKKEDKKPTYDFYTLLPANEVALSDDELAASERAEAAGKTDDTPKSEPAVQTPGKTDAATATQANATPAATNAVTAVNATATTKPATAEPKDDGAHYLLQAGAFQASGDAEAVKAKIAMLGLSARVESAQISDKTVYRVRMGPYGSASELADAKRRLSGGGLPAMAIKAR